MMTEFSECGGRCSCLYNSDNPTLKIGMSKEIYCQEREQVVCGMDLVSSCQELYRLQ